MKLIANLTAEKVKEVKDAPHPAIACTHHENGKAWLNVALTHQDVRVFNPNATVIIPLDEIIALAEQAEPLLKSLKIKK